MAIKNRVIKDISVTSFQLYCVSISGRQILRQKLNVAAYQFRKYF